MNWWQIFQSDGVGKATSGKANLKRGERNNIDLVRININNKG